MTQHITILAEVTWYDLFSRGARDWLRHNEKIRESVKQNLPDIVAEGDLITGPQERTVRVPVRMLEHARFRLSDQQDFNAAGQGPGKPGDVLTPVPKKNEEGKQAGNQDGEITLMLELKVDDILDWLWDELKLPDLRPKRGTNVRSDELVREGWDKHGARARLDRRRTVKEAVKRRAVQTNPVPFTNEDLRFHTLVPRRRPSTSAVVLFALDVSASMTEAERLLAKTFFFFALQGLRRKYDKVETRFIAHTTQAWEFSENEFFQVAGTGGTGASSAFVLALDLIHTQYHPAHYNSYLFYASDGENFSEDHDKAEATLKTLAESVNYIGYLETVPGQPRNPNTEMHMLCSELARDHASIGIAKLTRTEDVWQALRSFFMQQMQQEV